MDTFSLLNYQGSKKNLIDFIYNNCLPLIDKNKVVLDIFSGSGTISYGFKRNFTVFANDSEFFSSIIATALLGKKSSCPIEELKNIIIENYKNNKNRLMQHIEKHYTNELEGIENQDFTKINELYANYPTVWNEGYSSLCSNNLSPNNIINLCAHHVYCLFSTYYASSYFGIVQAVDIDSLRFAIELIKNGHLKSVLLSCLFYAMKECVFSKDGHMAQPLNLEKYTSRMFKQRNKSILQLFFRKLDDFFNDDFVDVDNNNRVFNTDFETLITYDDIKNDVGFIYADPPYTDMQYSRYYHLLNIVSKYNYPQLSIKNGFYTAGLYTEGRYQSKLSQRGNCLASFTLLMEFCKKYGKNLAVSFAYPRDTSLQKSDRYVMTIDEIVDSAKSIFQIGNVELLFTDYFHSNNRNSEAKKVLEYLILCKGR